MSVGPVVVLEVQLEGQVTVGCGPELSPILSLCVDCWAQSSG